jgi:hypothetical protein
LTTIIHIGHGFGDHDLTTSYFPFTIESLVFAFGKRDPLFISQAIGYKKTNIMAR